MAKLHYKTSTAQNAEGSNFGALNLFDPEAISTPTIAFSVTGWSFKSSQMTFDKRDGSTSLMKFGYKQGATTLTKTPVKPNAAPSNALGDCWRTNDPLTGTFAKGTWEVQFALWNNISGANDSRGRVKTRIWVGKDPTGVGVRPVTNVFNGTVENFSTGNRPIPSRAAPYIESFSLDNEYIFFQLAWEDTFKAQTAWSEMWFVYDSGNDPVSQIVTADFAPTLTVSSSNGPEYGNAPNAADLSTSSGPVSVIMTDQAIYDPNNPSQYIYLYIPDNSLVMSRNDSTAIAGDNTVVFGGIDSTPQFDANQGVSYNANESQWLLGEYLI